MGWFTHNNLFRIHKRINLLPLYVYSIKQHSHNQSSSKNRLNLFSYLIAHARCNNKQPTKAITQIFILHFIFTAILALGHKVFGLLLEHNIFLLQSRATTAYILTIVPTFCRENSFPSRSCVCEDSSCSSLMPFAKLFYKISFQTILRKQFVFCLNLFSRKISKPINRNV